MKQNLILKNSVSYTPHNKTSIMYHSSKEPVVMMNSFYAHAAEGSWALAAEAGRVFQLFSDSYTYPRSFRLKSVHLLLQVRSSKPLSTKFWKFSLTSFSQRRCAHNNFPLSQPHQKQWSFRRHKSIRAFQAGFMLFSSLCWKALYSTNNPLQNKGN